MQPETLIANVYTRATDDKPERLLAVCKSANGELPISPQALNNSYYHLSVALADEHLVEREGVPVSEHIRIRESEFSHVYAPGYKDQGGQEKIFPDPKVEDCRLELVATYEDGQVITNPDVLNGDMSRWQVLFHAVNRHDYRVEHVATLTGVISLHGAREIMHRYVGSTLETIRQGTGRAGEFAVVAPLTTPYIAREGSADIEVRTTSIEQVILPGVVVHLEHYEPHEGVRISNAARDAYETVAHGSYKALERLAALAHLSTILVNSEM